MKIGKLNLSNPVILAPMAGVTDQPFRRLVREMGCGLVYSEMVSDKGINYRTTSPVTLYSFRKSRCIALWFISKMVTLRHICR